MVLPSSGDVRLQRAERYSIEAVANALEILGATRLVGAVLGTAGVLGVGLIETVRSFESPCLNTRLVISCML